MFKLVDVVNEQSKLKYTKSVLANALLSNNVILEESIVYKVLKITAPTIPIKKYIFTDRKNSRLPTSLLLDILIIEITII